MVQYKKGDKNRAANAMSRKDQKKEETLMLISFLTIDWLGDLKVAYATNPKEQYLVSLFNENNLGLDYIFFKVQSLKLGC